MDNLDVGAAILGWIGVAILLATLGAWAVMLLIPLATAGAVTISFVQAIAISLLAGILFRGRK